MISMIKVMMMMKFPLTPPTIPHSLSCLKVLKILNDDYDLMLKTG